MISIPELIARSALWFGDAVAVVEGERTLSFRQVDDRANRFANALRYLSPTVGARVALLTRNRLESVECDFGICKAAKVRVPINVRLADREREFLLSNSKAETLVFDSEYGEFVEEARKRVPSLLHTIALGKRCEGSHFFDDLLEQASSVDPKLPYDPESPNFILYTSGTTGQPKGATATNRSRAAATFNMLADELDVRAGDAMAHVGSMAHGSGSKVLAFFLRGARNIAVPRFDPEQFLDLVTRERVTNSFLVPTMISALYEAAAAKTSDLTSLRTITYGGAPMPPANIAAAVERFGPIWVQVYGSCEAPHPVLVLRKEDHLVQLGRHGRLASAGREVLRAEVRLMTDSGDEVADGEMGELWVKGPNVMRGYWDDTEATNEVFAQGFYRTGDVARRDSDGYYYIIDRKRDMLISGGLNVYPAEVEAILQQHPAVLDAVVLGVPDSRWGEAVKALVVLRSGQAATEADIIEHCRQLLASYKKPTSVEFRDALPKGPTGKILKRELREPYWKDEARSV